MTELFRTIAIVAVHTPVWVWVLYALLLFLGLQRTRDSTVLLVRVLILPVVVAGLAIASLVARGLNMLPAMLAGLVLGSTAGWLLEPESATHRLADGRVWLRGEWWSLAQIVAVLALRYAMNVIPIMAPMLNANPVWHVGSLFISAALSGLFLGRTASRLGVYFAQGYASRREEPADVRSGP